jgi:hypothetical protein
MKITLLLSLIVSFSLNTSRAFGAPFAENVKVLTPIDISMNSKSLTSFGGYGLGNGGDFVRASFIKIGFEITNYLNNDKAGKRFVQEYNINTFAFPTVLNTRVLFPVSDKPVDMHGVPVDAIFKNGNLYLHTKTWEDLLKSNADTYMMVFHEMLRVTGHFDDEFVISRNLNMSNGTFADGNDSSQIKQQIFCYCGSGANLGGRDISVALNCKNLNTGKDIISNLIIDSNEWREGNEIACRKEGDRIISQLSDSAEEDNPIIDYTIEVHSGVVLEQNEFGEWPQIGEAIVSHYLSVDGYEKQFGLACRSDNTISYLVSPGGGIWKIKDVDLCLAILSALLTSSSDNKVTLMFYNNELVDLRFLI